MPAILHPVVIARADNIVIANAPATDKNYKMLVQAIGSLTGMKWSKKPNHVQYGPDRPASAG
jgi:hypothetical protein